MCHLLDNFFTCHQVWQLCNGCSDYKKFHWFVNSWIHHVACVTQRFKLISPYGYQFVHKTNKATFTYVNISVQHLIILWKSSPTTSRTMLDHKVVFETCELGHLPKESCPLFWPLHPTMFLCVYYSLKTLGIDIVKA
jgi:hypothetical protein